MSVKTPTTWVLSTPTGHVGWVETRIKASAVQDTKIQAGAITAGKIKADLDVLAVTSYENVSSRIPVYIENRCVGWIKSWVNELRARDYSLYLSNGAVMRLPIIEKRYEIGREKLSLVSWDVIDEELRRRLAKEGCDETVERTECNDIACNCVRYEWHGLLATVEKLERFFDETFFEPY